MVYLHCGLAASSINYSDCPNKLSVLEQILFEYDNNELELNKAFFPPIGIVEQEQLGEDGLLQIGGHLQSCQ